MPIQDAILKFDGEEWKLVLFFDNATKSYREEAITLPISKENAEALKAEGVCVGCGGIYFY